MTLTTALESFIQEKMVETRIPSLSLALIDQAEVHYQQFGFKDLASRTPPTAETLFGLGSITKVFTAVAVLQLHDRGLLHVDDPIVRYLGTEFLTDTIHIKHLLSHTSGLPALGFSESKMSARWWMDGYPISSLTDVQRFMHDATDWTQARPGERWFYLNEGYILLGAIIEQVAGQLYSDYVQEQLLTPLRMSRSFFTRAEVEAEPDTATPYLQQRDAALFVGANLYSELPAAGGLVSCATDMSKFAHMLLRGGSSETGERLLSEDSLARLSEPFVSLPAHPLPGLSDTQESFHGLGLQRHRGFFAHDVVGHGGGVMGGTSYLALLPEQQRAVLLLANAHGYPMLQLALAALANLQGENHEELSFVRHERTLKALEGDYYSFKGTMHAQVRRYGGGLELRLCFFHEDRVLTLFPLSLTPQRSSFQAYSAGRQLLVDFQLNAGQLELIYERYAFRKV